MKDFRHYTPTDRQRAFHSCSTWNGNLVKGAIGGLSGGKSRCCEEEQIERCLVTPYGKSVAMRQANTKAEFSLIDDYKKLLRGIARWVPSESIFLFDNGHKLYVVPGKDFDRFGSTEFTTFYIQEAQEVEFRVFDALCQRLRDPAGLVDGVPYWCGLFDARGVTTSHWIHKEFIEKAWSMDTPPETRKNAKIPGFVYCKFKTTDNPHQRPGYVRGLLDQHKGDPNWVRVFIGGETGIPVDGTPVFPEFDLSAHVGVIEEDRSLPILRGVDFGHRHPAVTWSQFTRDGRFVVLRELCPKLITQDDLHREVEALQRSEFPTRPRDSYLDYGDVAGTNENDMWSTQVERWENHFGTTMECQGGVIQAGHEILRNLMTRTRKVDGFTRPCLMVDKSCETLIEGLSGGYCYKKTDDGRDQVDRNNAWKDVIDSVRYVAQIVTSDAGYGQSYGWIDTGETMMAVY